VVRVPPPSIPRSTGTCFRSGLFMVDISPGKRPDQIHLWGEKAK
jgi:hypothetical protein